MDASSEQAAEVTCFLQAARLANRVELRMLISASVSFCCSCEALLLALASSLIASCANTSQ